MKLSDFDFDLPLELIAQNPISKRDESNLLIASTQQYVKTKFYNIIDYLKEGDLLVFNNSKVIKAKLNLDRNITINLNQRLKDNRRATSDDAGRLNSTTTGCGRAGRLMIGTRSAVKFKLKLIPI